MELKQYWYIIWKRIWIPVLLLFIVAGASILTSQTPSPTYNVTMRFTVGIKPQNVNNQYNYDGYYAWLSSEYLVDNLTNLISSQDLTANVNKHLEEMGNSVKIPPGIISTEKQHRVLRLNVNWGNADELVEIAKAVVITMEKDVAKYFPQTSAPIIQVIDPPTPPAANPPSLTQRLNLPVRLLLALVAGLALTFLLDYLDDSVRGRADLEALGVSVLAEVPKGRR